MFHKAFRSCPNAISITTLKKMRVINVNDSFLKFTGYTCEEITNKTFEEINLFPSPEDSRLLTKLLKRHGRLRNHEIEFVTKRGEPRTGVISAEIIELWNKQCVLSNIGDVTETKRLEKEITNASEKERQKIGQSLHDDLCPHLIGTEVLTKVLKRKLEDRSVDEALLADKIRVLLSEAISKTRNLTRGLLPVYLVDHGLESSIRDLARNTEEVFGISCVLKYDDSILFNDNRVATQLFYIIQEALHNAVKHSEAENIVIDLSVTDGKITIKITDDGIGIPEVPGTGGMGLHIMGFRAKNIDASLDIRRNNDKGTTVLISFKKRGYPLYD